MIEAVSQAIIEENSVVEDVANAGKDSFLSVENLNAYYGTSQAVINVTLGIKGQAATAIIGPSGCGKSTLLRCMNRMHEVARGARVEGKVLLDGEDLYGPSVNVTQVRRRIRDGLSEAQSIPDHVDLRECRGRPQAGRGA